MRVYSTKFRIRDDQQTDWIPYFKGYELSPEGRTDTGIKLENIDAKDKRGASQTVILNQDKPRKVLISGWSKAEEISGQPDSSYGIVADISFMDRSSAWVTISIFSINYQIRDSKLHSQLEHMIGNIERWFYHLINPSNILL